MDWIFCIFFTIIICKNSTGTMVYRYNSTPTTWTDAKSYCNNNGGHLVNGSNENQLISCNDFPTNESFWIGMYDIFASWIQISGCAQLNISITNYETYTTDNALSCAEHCNISFGLMNDTCICLPDDLKTVNHYVVDDSLCPLRCHGNSQDSCGGSDYVTLYKKLEKSEVTDRADEEAKNDIMCGLVECTNTGWKYFGYSCNQSNHAYCNDKNISSIINTWEYGQEACWNLFNSFLIGEAISEVECSNETSKAPVWAGIYRRKIVKHVTGDDLLEDTSTCFPAILYNGQSQRDNSINCSVQLPFVCQIDTDTVLKNDCLKDKTGPTTVTMETTVSSSGTETANAVTTETTATTMIASETALTTTVTIETTAKTTSPSETETTTTFSMETTEPTLGLTETAAPMAGSSKVSTSGEIEPGIAVAVSLGLGLPLAAAVLSIVSYCVRGQRPKIKRSASKDIIVLKNKEDFYIRPAGEDMAEINPRYSLFENEDDAEKKSITYDSKQGRVSTFLGIPKFQNSDNLSIGVLISPEDVVTKL